MNPPNLLSFLAQAIIDPVTKKGWFSEPYVLLGNYMSCAQFLYETGSVLGLTYRDRITVFAQLFSEAGREAEALGALRNSLDSKLSKTCGQPKDFIELFFRPEAERLMETLRKAGLTTYSDWLDFPKVARQKLRRKDVFTQLQFTVAEGIALGAFYPTLVERLLTHAEDEEMWDRARTAGLEIPERPPKPKPIPERQAEAVEAIRPYLQQMRPDLLVGVAMK